MKGVKILAALVAALSILNSSGASPGATEKVAALVTALYIYIYEPPYIYIYMCVCVCVYIYIYIYISAGLIQRTATATVIWSREHRGFWACEFSG